METNYATVEPSRSAVEALPGATLLEFGAPWCGWCQGAQAHIRIALDGLSQVHHIKVEDGPGRPLGRSYKVKLWPTLILLADGVEVARLVRPGDAAAIRDALDRLVAAR